MNLLISIVPPVVFFVLSLIGAYVLFKKLKSSANINKPSQQIRGALAGFVIIFGLLSSPYYFYDAVPGLAHRLVVKQYERKIEKLQIEVTEITKKWKPQDWKITGYISKDGPGSYEEVDATYQPPNPYLQIVPENGSFCLYGVKISEGCGWPTFQFSCKGFMPDEYKIDPKKDAVDKNDNTIRLKDRIYLAKIDEIVNTE